jgi:myosin V
MEIGMKVWAAGGPDLWQQGTVMKKTRKGDSYELEVTLDKGGSKVYNTSANDEDEIEELKLRNVAGQATIYEGRDVADLTQLTHLHEPAILHSLHMRYNENQIYTYTGPILLAVNPFQKVAQYSDKILNSYKVDGERRCYDPNHQETMAPHVYALADKAYRNMTMPTTEYNLRSQSILVSGESGQSLQLVDLSTLSCGTHSLQRLP